MDKVFHKVNIGKMEEGARPGEKEYAGMYYLDHGHGNIEFTHGTLSNETTRKWGHLPPGKSFGLLDQKDTPKAVRNASSIKFDDVDTSQVTSMDDMFGYDSNLKSVDFGNNFDTSHVDNSRRGFDSMFDLDYSLANVNFGDKFDTSHVNIQHMDDMFAGDSNIHLTGKAVNSANVKDMYNHRNVGYPFSNSESGTNHYPFSTDLKDNGGGIGTD